MKRWYSREGLWEGITEGIASCAACSKWECWSASCSNIVCRFNFWTCSCCSIFFHLDSCFCAAIKYSLLAWNGRKQYNIPACSNRFVFIQHDIDYYIMSRTYGYHITSGFATKDSLLADGFDFGRGVGWIWHVQSDYCTLQGVHFFRHWLETSLHLLQALVEILRGWEIFLLVFIVLIILFLFCYEKKSAKQRVKLNIHFAINYIRTKNVSLPCTAFVLASSSAVTHSWRSTSVAALMWNVCDPLTTKVQASTVWIKALCSDILPLQAWDTSAGFLQG